MNDDFIRSLKGDWQSQAIDAGKVLRRLQRNRWVPHIVLGAEILVCAFAFLVGLWFAWVGAHHEQHKLLFALSAGVLLLTAPALCVASVMARRPSLAWDVETPESVLSVGMRRAESSLRAMLIGRWHIAIIAAFVMTLWASDLLHRGLSCCINCQLAVDGAAGKACSQRTRRLRPLTGNAASRH